MTFGKKLKKRRDALRLTQQALADNVGVSYHTVLDWERGKQMPNSCYLPKICETLQVSADYLLDLDFSSETQKIKCQSCRRKLLLNIQKII